MKNNKNNTNTIFFVLIIMILIASIWGSIANRKNMTLRDKLEDMEAKISQLTEQSSIEREQVLGKSAGLQETLLQKEAQLASARNELVSLRKENQALEARISVCNATLDEIGEQKKKQQEMGIHGPGDARPAREIGGTAAARQAGGAGNVPAAGKRNDQENEMAAARLQQQFDACAAELMGLEQIIKERSGAMEAAGQEMNSLKVNLNVLLAKITDQQDELQELREENRRHLKEIADRNEEIAELQMKVMQQPVQE